MLSSGYGFLTVVNTFDLVRRTRGGVKWPVFGGGGGGNRGGALFWKGGLIWPIYKIIRLAKMTWTLCISKFECLGYPRGIGQFSPVILAFPRWRWAKATRRGVTNSTTAGDIWFRIIFIWNSGSHSQSLARIELYSKHCHYIRSYSIYYTN